MGLGIFFDEPDLDERLSRRRGRGLEGLDDEVDSELMEPEKGHAFYRHPKQPKAEIPEHIMIARRKAQQARAIINRQRKMDTTLKEYPFDFLINYFSRNPDADYRDILHIIKQQQNSVLDRNERGTETTIEVLRLMAQRANPNSTILRYLQQKYQL